MDSSLIWIFVLIGVIVVLLIARPLIKQWARGKGAERTVDKKRSQTGPEELGATLLLATDAGTAREIVAPIIEGQKRVVQQPDGTWAKTHYNDNDIVYALAQTPEGARVSIARAIEFAGTVNGAKEWRSIREAITAAAQGRGVAVTVGGGQLVPGQPLVDNGPQVYYAAVTP